MRKPATVILTLIILASALASLQLGHATYVNSSINYDTIWTRANSPYILTDNIFVNMNAKLTIEAGVTVNLGIYQLQVDGTLIAKGATSDRIVFLGSSSINNYQIVFYTSSAPWNEQTGSGCIIDNAILTSVRIVLNNASPKISNTYFSGGSTLSTININGGSPSIVNNAINSGSGSNGIMVISGSPTISSNYLAGYAGNSGTYGIYVGSSAGATITNNKIVNYYSGILSDGQSNIQGNTIMNNANDGIASNNPSSTVQGNAVANNKCGISGTGNIQYNTITKNEFGIWGPKITAIIKNNNIYDNDNSISGVTQNIHLTERNTDINLTYNWWATTDLSAINQTLWDIKNDPDYPLGYAIFDPILTERVSSAPDIPSSVPIPTPPPTPVPPSSTPTPTVTTPPTPTPTYATPTPPYTATPTWTWPTNTPDPYQTPPVYPTSTDSSIEPHPELDLLDIANIAVVGLAIIAAVAIIVAINKMNRKKPSPTA